MDIERNTEEDAPRPIAQVVGDALNLLDRLANDPDSVDSTDAAALWHAAGGR